MHLHLGCCVISKGKILIYGISESMKQLYTAKSKPYPTSCFVCDRPDVVEGSSINEGIENPILTTGKAAWFSVVLVVILDGKILPGMEYTRNGAKEDITICSASLAIKQFVSASHSALSFILFAAASRCLTKIS